MSTKRDILVNTNIVTPALSFDGVGFPLIIALEKDLAYTEYNIERDLSELEVDFDVTDETYLKALAIISQNQHVKKIAVVGVLYAPTTITEVLAETLTDSGDGLTFDFANGDIIEETIKNITIDDVAFDIEDLASIDYAVGNMTFGSSQTGAVVKADYKYYTVVGDITTITDKLLELVNVTATNKWYLVLSPFWTKDEIEPIATFLTTQFTPNRNRKYSSFTTPQISLQTDLTNDRVDLQLHDNTQARTSDALMGYGLSLEPGELTYKDVTLVGVPLATYNRTQLNSIDLVNGQTYIEKDDQNVTTEGLTTGTRFIDSIQAEDAIENRIAKKLQEAFAKSTKIPNSPAGDTIITNVISGVMEALVETEATPGLIKKEGTNKLYAIDFSGRTFDPETRKLSGIVVVYVESGAVHAIEIDVDITLS